MSIEFIFPDTGLLMNFAVLKRVDLLEGFIVGRGVWTRTIFDEVARMSRENTYSELSKVFDFMPSEPHEADATEMQTGEQIRRRLAKPEDSAVQHWGECETLAVILHRYSNAELLVLTEDKGVLSECDRLGIKTVTTALILKFLASTGILTWAEADAAAIDLQSKRRPILGYPPAIRQPMPEGIRPQSSSPSQRLSESDPA